MDESFGFAMSSPIRQNAIVEAIDIIAKVIPGMRPSIGADCRGESLALPSRLALQLRASR